MLRRGPMTQRPRRCKHCKERLDRVGPVIHEACIEPWLVANKEKLAAQKKAAERKQDRVKRELMKKLPKLIAEAQEAFNEFIRLRDRAKGCFVCGCAFPVGQLGGDFDAGHVRSRGAAGHLRFNEDNCHGECKSCNSSTGAKPHEIEAGAIRRIGQKRFDSLKNNNTPHKWEKDEVRAIRDDYRARARQMKKEMQCRA